MSMEGTGQPLPQALLAHSGWARRLARHLVSEAQVDDLVQDALVAGLRRPPAGDRPIRGWLATVLRNLALNRTTAERRRQAREQRVAEADAAAPSAEEALATVQLHRQLARLVEKLPPDDRRIVVLHYFEERSSGEIGKLLELPAATVRWRLGRAVEQLRAWLDEEAGGARQRWMLALAPLLRAPAPLSAGAVLGLTLACALLVATIATLALLPRRPAMSGGAGPPPPPSAPGARPPAFASAAGGRTTLASVPATSCPAALEQAQDEREAIERDLLQYEDPAIYFENAAPSPANQDRFAPLVTDLLSPELGGVLECRSGICRVLLVRHPTRTGGRCVRVCLIVPGTSG
jgi:RNA polymerase sigma-70 factor (ECF subfamily)